MTIKINMKNIVCLLLSAIEKSKPSKGKRFRLLNTLNWVVGEGILERWLEEQGCEGEDVSTFEGRAFQADNLVCRSGKLMLLHFSRRSHSTCSELGVKTPTAKVPAAIRKSHCPRGDRLGQLWAHAEWTPGSWAEQAGRQFFSNL